MKPLRRAAASARREATPSGEIDGSTPAEADLGNMGSGGCPYGTDGALRSGGSAAASHGAAHVLHAPRGRGVDPTWPSSPAAAPTTSLIQYRFRTECIRETYIDMPEAWWKETTKKTKGCTRFKNRGIQNEKQLEIMFEDIRNTGDDHWCASSGVAPSQFNPPPSPIPVDYQDEAVNEDNDSEPEKVTPTSGKGKRGKGADNNKRKEIEDKYRSLVS
ncbi:uncharacterized protein C2845_PM01G45510 [Panicum miliaceum]|uniref:Uncharacterized protein n=1 Tax=Panicum miliaceum TaxID=4540 RepID=A0A3L6TSF3_PANMI|nr:uncharacterized protein C2845_PM01G45510 [Panicum miliaceum]